MKGPLQYTKELVADVQADIDIREVEVMQFHVGQKLRRTAPIAIKETAKEV